MSFQSNGEKVEQLAPTGGELTSSEILDRLLDCPEATKKPPKKEWFKDQDIARLTPEKQLIVAILIDADRLINKQRDIKGNWHSTRSQNEMRKAKNWVITDDELCHVMTFNWACLILDLNLERTRRQILELGGFPGE